MTFLVRHDVIVVHFNYQLVRVENETTSGFYCYRPCFGHPDCPDGHEITVRLEEVTCTVCKQTDPYKELLIEFEASELTQNEFANMYAVRLRHHTVEVHSEKERAALDFNKTTMQHLIDLGLIRDQDPT